MRSHHTYFCPNQAIIPTKDSRCKIIAVYIKYNCNRRHS